MAVKMECVYFICQLLIFVAYANFELDIKLGTLSCMDGCC